MRALHIALIVLCHAVPASPQTQTASSQLPALKQMSIEELLNVDVTLPMRTAERVFEAPSAVTVLTGEDVRRSGAVTLPEALRYAPGVFAARFSNSSWVIATRGFASTASNKLLVMIDGRTVYSPLFSGVFWESQDRMLGDVDRIEITRGPGAALWGANAVNGIINVISKPATDTQGTLVTFGAGAEERYFGAVRHGGRLGEGSFRVFGKYVDRDASRLASGAEARDWQRAGYGGFRGDFGTAASGFTLQGEAFSTHSGASADGDIEMTGGHVLWRGTRPVADGRLQVQAYLDATARLVPGQIDEVRRTFDVEAQLQPAPRGRHAFTVGGGYRWSWDDTTPSLLAFEPEDRLTYRAGLFVQDQFTLGTRWALVAGLRADANSYTGVEWQPSVRVRWSVPRHTAWAAASRAVRLPTRLETDVLVRRGTVVTLRGNPDLEAETLVAYEAGYRLRPIDTLSIDLSAFANRYDRLRTQNLPSGAGQPITVGNGLNDVSTGLESMITYQPRGWARFTASHVWLAHDLTLDAGVRDVFDGLAEVVDPPHQLLLQARLDLPRSMELDVIWRGIAELPGVRGGTPAAANATVRLGWRPRPSTEISLVGRDILHAERLEFGNLSSPDRYLQERALFARVTIAF